MDHALSSKSLARVVVIFRTLTKRRILKLDLENSQFFDRLSVKS